MLCSLTRWMISRAEDRGKKMPRFAAYHVGRCRTCREFAGFAESLSSRLAKDTRAFLVRIPDFVLEPPAPAAGNAQRSTQGHRRRRLTVYPFPAAAIALVVVVSAFVLIRIAGREPAPSPLEKKTALAALQSVSSVPAEFQGAVVEAESYLANESLILEKSVLSAVEYLQARFNIKIERKESPNSLSGARDQL